MCVPNVCALESMVSMMSAKGVTT